MSTISASRTSSASSASERYVPERPSVSAFAASARLPGHGVLVDPDAGATGFSLGSVGRGPECERAVAVADDDEPAGVHLRARLRGLIEDEPVRGIRCRQIGGLDVGPAPQRV